MNIEKYKGLVYKPNGRNLDGVDCYGLVRLVYKNELNIDLPSFDTDYQVSDLERIQDLIAQYKEGWEVTQIPTLGSVVLFRIMGSESHIGIALSDTEFLHVREGMDSVVESLSNAKWKNRVVGYFNYIESVSTGEGATLNALPHPLKTKKITCTIPEGSTVLSVVRQVIIDNDTGVQLDQNIIVMLNGIPIDKKSWGDCIVKNGDSLEYRSVPTGSNGRMALFIIVSIIAAYVTAGVSSYASATAGVGGATGGLGMSAAGAGALGAMAGAATTMVGAALINKIAPIRQPDANNNNPQSSERQLMVSGGANSATPYGSKPVILGKVRITPPLGAQNYLTFENERDSYLSMYLEWGFGPLKIFEKSFKIGEIPLTNYKDYEIITLDRRTEPSAEVQRNFNRIYGKDVDQKNLSQIIVCEGDPRKTVVPGPWVQSSSLQRVDSVTLSFHFPEGLHKLQIKGEESGSISGVNLALRIESSSNGSTWQYLDSFSVVPAVSRTVVTYEERPSPAQARWVLEEVRIETIVTEYLAKKDAFTLNKSYKSSALGNLNFIRVRRETGDNPDDDSSYRYAFQSYLQTVTFRSNLSPAIDPPNCKIAKTAIKIKASEQLNGNLQGFNGIVQSVAPVWTGREWIDAPTSNPASLFMMVLLHPANPRRRTMSQIDLPELVVFYNYCNLRGFEYNGILAAQKSVNEVLRDICSAGRASPNLKDGLHTVVIDQPKPITQHFTSHNSWGFEAVKNLPEIPHGLRIQYYDQENGYQQAEIIVYNTGYSSSNASLFESVQFPGVTLKSLVIDHARFHFAQAKLRPEAYSFSTDIEYLVSNRGDRCKMVHDVPLWGLGSGRIKNRISDKIFELDEEVPMELGKSYTMRVRSSSGASTIIPLVNVTTNGYYTTVTSTRSIDIADCNYGDLFLFGELSTGAQDVMILSVEPSENMTAKLTVVDYGVTDTYNIFNDYLTLTENVVFETQITLPPVFSINAFGDKLPTITGFVSDETLIEKISKDVFRYSMNVSYTNSESLPNQVHSVEAQYDLSANLDSLSSQISRSEYTKGVITIKDVVEGETYKVRLRYLGIDGRLGSWTPYEFHTVVGKTTRPAAVTGFKLEADYSIGRSILTWDANLEPDIKGYEVRVNPNFGKETGLIASGEFLTCFVDSPSLVGQSITYYICAIDYAGNYSKEISQAGYTNGSSSGGGTTGPIIVVPPSVLGLSYDLGVDGIVTITVQSAKDVAIKEYQLRSVLGNSFAEASLIAVSDSEYKFRLPFSTLLGNSYRVKAEYVAGGYGLPEGLISFSLGELAPISTLMFTIEEPDLLLEWPAVVGADYYALWIEEGGVTRFRKTSDTKYSIPIPKYDLNVRVVVGTKRGRLSTAYDTTIDVTGKYNRNEIVNIPIDMTTGTFIGLANLGSTAVERPDLTGPSQMIFPITNSNSATLYSFGYNLENTPGTVLENISGEWFKDDFWKVKDGYYESPVIDMGAILTGFVKAKLNKIVEYHGASGLEHERVLGEYLAEYTAAELANDKAFLSVKLYITSGNPSTSVWTEIQDEQVVTGRYVKMVIQALSVGPLTRVRVTSGAIALDVPDKTLTGKITFSGSSGFVGVADFTKINVVLCTPDKPSRVWANNLTALGFTVNTDNAAPPTTVSYFIKGY